VTKRKYRPYRSRKQRSQRTMRNIGLALIVLIVGIVILVKSSKDGNSPENNNGTETRSIGDILPRGGAETETASGSGLPMRVAPIEPKTIELVKTTPEPVEEAQEPVVEARQEEPVVESVLVPPIVPTIQVDSGKTSPEATAFIEQAIELKGKGKIIAARDLLNHTLDLQLSSTVRAGVKDQLAKLSEIWLFSDDVYESDKLTYYYRVQSGDLLSVIGKRYNVPYEILMKINGIPRPEALQADQKIKVIDGPFNVVVYKSSFTMDLYLQNVYVKTYRVGLGKVNYETPAGRWRVKKGGKLISPRWTDRETGKVYVASSPDYPLGSRWIAIEGLDEKTKDKEGFAIHGTKEPESIGTRSSRGCIRLYNGDVIEVYNLLQEGVSEVLIVE
jgi:lipoprotein-anchoring transpeptidase ErfK/SrfK